MPEPVSVRRLPPCGMILIRADLEAAAEALAGAAGVPVPAVRRAETAGDRALWWMSPDEALLCCPAEEAGGLAVALRAALSGRSHLVEDLSDARIRFAVEGEGAREVLAKGAPVDLSRGAFGPGDLRRTRLGQVAAAFRMTSRSPDAFELICFRSVADHVEAWLAHAARPGSLPGVL